MDGANIVKHICGARTKGHFLEEQKHCENESRTHRQNDIRVRLIIYRCTDTT